MSSPPASAALLALWYGAWIALAILLAKGGVIGMVIALGGGAVAFLLMEVWARQGIAPKHLVGAILTAGIVHGLAKVALVLMTAP